MVVITDTSKRIETDCAWLDEYVTLAGGESWKTLPGIGEAPSDFSDAICDLVSTGGIRAVVTDSTGGETGPFICKQLRR